MAHRNTFQQISNKQEKNVRETLAEDPTAFDPEDPPDPIGEIADVANPNTAASPATERRIRTGQLFGTGAQALAFARDAQSAATGKSVPEPVGKTADVAAGRSDESVSRQFDKEPGGGFADFDLDLPDVDTSGLGDVAALIKGLVILVVLGVLVQVFAPVIQAAGDN